MTIETVLTSFYVDDLLKSVTSEQEVDIKNIKEGDIINSRFYIWFIRIVSSFDILQKLSCKSYEEWD